jgi:alpha-1,2-glucosyltransferase
VKALPRNVWGLVGFSVAAIAALVSLQDNFLLADERVHYGQIVAFARGYSRIDPRLTMIPGYHALMASAAWMTGALSTNAVRFFTFVVGMSAVGAFYFASRAEQTRNPTLATLQFAFLPIAFPSFSLIYTDITSLLFVLLMVLAALKRRHGLAGLFGLLSCLIRQNNIVWVVFVLLWSYVSENGWTWTPLRQILSKYWVFLLTGMLFVVFVAVNGGVALGDVNAHPLSSLHLGNVFFLLFLSFFLFLPVFWARRREALAPLRTWPGRLGLAVLFAVFWFGFDVDHPYNTQWGDLYMRNAVLIFFTSTWFLKLLLFVPIALAVLSLMVAPLRQHGWLLYPFTILFLLPSWLIEQRYYLIPLSLFLLVREPVEDLVERLQLGLFFLMSAALFMVVERGWMFI